MSVDLWDTFRAFLSLFLLCVCVCVCVCVREQLSCVLDSRFRGPHVVDHGEKLARLLSIICLLEIS